MHTNKVFQVICALNRTDRRRLILFMDSPYFNKSKTHVHLTRIFTELAESGQHEGFEKQAIWKQVFPNTEYDDVNFRKYCSDLLRLVERFLAQQAIEAKNENFLIETFEEVVNKKIQPLYSSAVRAVQDFLSSVKSQSSDYFFLGFRHESIFYKLNEKEKIYKNRVNIEETSNNLDVFYFIEKIKILCSSLTHQKLMNVKYDIAFANEINLHLGERDLSNFTVLQAYYLKFKMMSDENDFESYFKLKTLLEENFNKIPPFDLFDLTHGAINFCTSKVNTGQTDFLSEYFDMIDFGVRNKIFTQFGEFDSWLFTNFVIIGIRLGKFEWVENFINSNEQFLNDQDRDNIVSFNLARLFYNKKEYDKVLGLLRNTEYRDLSLNLNCKIILIATYYETEEFDALDSFMESFRVFLNRHKDISLQRRKSFLNCIKFTRRLMRLPPGNPAAIQRLREELQKEKNNTVNFDWLMAKIAEVER